MSWIQDALKALRKVILIEEKVKTLAEDVKQLAFKYQELSERLARIEGKFEAYEQVARAARIKKLPRPRSRQE